MTEQVDQFLSAAGWAGATRAPLAGDASSRQYQRLTQQGASAILMIAPAGAQGGTPAFASIARYLRSNGFSAPKIFAARPDAGLMLIEDFGDALFASDMARDATTAPMLYALATDVLIALHRAPLPNLAVYDALTMADQAMLMCDWALPNAPAIDPDLRAPLHLALMTAARPFDHQKRVVMLRDYHAENLIRLPRRAGVAAAGLLDFQDAMLGHPAYDLVSLLQDARRDVPPAIAEAMTFRYLSDADRDSSDFYTAYAVFGAGRALRILGIFARLAARDGKPRYLEFVPRVRTHLATNLAHPALAEVNALLSPWMTGQRS